MNYFEFEEEKDNQGELILSEFTKEIKDLKVEQNTSKQQQHQELKKIIGMQSQSLKIKFQIIVKFFEKVGQVRGKKKSEVTLSFFENFAFKDDRNPQYAYTILRLILPFYDRDRGVYKLQEKAIAKLFHQALGLPDTEYQRMANYKYASLQPYGAPVGDFPSVVHSVIEGFCRKDSIITIGELDATLDELVQCQDTNGQVTILTKLIQKCTADELMWIVRIILKDLKIGLKHEKVLEYYHPDAVEFFNVTSSLKEVCKEFEDRNHSLKNVLRLFHPIKPMLAARKTPMDIRSLLEGKDFLIETKYDGERIQCHFNPDQIRYFTRNAKDYTETYGAKMNSLIRQCVQAHSCILDGEIVVLEKDTGNQVQFGMNRAIAREIEDEHSEMQLCYKVFDVLYVKGFQGEECNTMKLKLNDRRKILKRIIKPIPNYLELMNGVETANFDDIITEFDRAIMRNEEGIIIKQTDTEYHPNDRSSKWVKMKGDYLEGLTDTFDVIIVGGFFGNESNRTDKYDQIDRITHFLLGVGAKIDKENPQNCLVYPFCKVGTGYTVQQLQSIRNKLRPYLIMREGRFKPNYLPQNWIPGVSERPDCYVDNPCHSIILELKAAELMKSNTFPTDYTLRFPRTANVRHDKEWYEMMRVEELQEMVNQTQVKKKKAQQADSGGSKQGSDDEVDGMVQVKGKRVKQNHFGRKPIEGGGLVRVMKQFQMPDVSNLAYQSNLFNNFEFYIVNTDQKIEKHELEGLVIQNGGQTVTHLIGSRIDFKIETIVEKHPVIVVKPEWIIECLRRNKIVDFSPRFILYAQDYILLQNKEYYDMYGDSYYEDVDPIVLNQIMECMPKKLENVEQKSLKNKLLSSSLRDVNDVLLQKQFYIWGGEEQISDYDLCLLEIRIIRKGGKIAKQLSSSIDYLVLFDNYSTIQEKQIEQFLNYNPKIKTTSVKNLQYLINNK